MSRTTKSVYDRYITIFSPEGKLYQVEYALRAIKNSGLTAIALKGSTAACLVVQKKIPVQEAQQDKLLDISSVTSLYKITDHIASAMIGLPGDCRSMIFRARDVANKAQFTLGHEITVQNLTKKIANLNQVYTQHAYMRLHACSGMFIGIDEETNSPVIYRFDPAGWFAGYSACATGTKEDEAMTALEKIKKSKTLSTEAEVIEEALICLQLILSVDFRAKEVEVAVVSRDSPKVRMLDETTIDYYLNRISDRD